MFGVITSRKLRSGDGRYDQSLGRASATCGNLFDQLRDRTRWHAIPGSHQKRMFSQRLPFTYSLMDTVADHIHWGGGHWTEARGDEKHDSAGGGHAPLAQPFICHTIFRISQSDVPLQHSRQSRQSRFARSPWKWIRRQARP
ncbi:MAG: hypothetical protein U0894_03780 [Pirellulales bacterium]